MGQDILVIGRGIVGASIAYYLQSAGAQVTIVADNSDRATDGSFGWINASFYNDEAHFHLRNEGLAAYRRLAGRLDVPINWTGCLCWETERAALRQQADDLQQLGYEARVIDRQVFSKLEPNIPNPPAACIHMPQEAAAESGALADALWQAAMDLGAANICGRVSHLVTDGDRVGGAVIDGTILNADQVVVAAGVHTPSLVKPLGITLPMLDRPAVIVKTKPIAMKLSHILVSRLGEVRQLPDGSILMPAAVGHQSYDTPSGGQDVDQTAQEALGRLEDFLGIALTLDWAKLAFRPVPQDGLPVVGSFSNGGYVAVMHSGITLAAIMGELVAEEVLSGTSADTDRWLGPHRPDRFP